MDIKHLELTHEEWYKIRDKIRAVHGDSMVILSFKMKRELGFTVRHHREREETDGFWGYKEAIHVDFYTEEAKVWFLLTYT
jgi:hypothetical protein